MLISPKISRFICSLDLSGSKFFERFQDGIFGRFSCIFACILFLFCLQSSAGFQAYTLIQTRRFPYQNWTWLKNNTPSQRTEVDDHVTNFDQSKFRLPPLELRDEPQGVNRYHTQRNYPPYFTRHYSYHTRHPTLPNRYPTNLQSHITDQRNNGVNSFPPWYADKYRRYPRDEAYPSTNGMLPNPWDYQPRCRSCGRPLLQDSFCSDDFVIRAFVYKEIAMMNGIRQFLVYIFEVYKDIKRHFQPTHYSRIAYRCDRFQTGPELGKLYLLTGLYVNNLPNVDSCSWRANWNEVTKQQKRYLRFKYQAFCGICKIQRVLRLNPNYHHRPDTCYVALTPNPNELVCRDKFSICRYKQQSQTCGFNQRTPYKICEKWLSSKV